MRMFRNDYSEGAAPEILAALAATNDEQTVGYTEGDAHCERARELIRAACGRDDVDVEFCVGGTSANVIGVTGLLRDWEGAVCTKDAHINVHETGAVAACGRTVLPTDDADGFLTPEAAERVWRFQTSTGRHMTRPGCVYVSNTTELGGVWDRARFDAICDWADEKGLPVFLDGARLGYGLAADGNDITLPYLARHCDAFYIGGTKAGALCGEAVVFTHGNAPRNFFTIQKQHGALMAKARLLGAQFDALFTDGLYLDISRHAIDMAKRMRMMFEKKGYRLWIDSPTNQQFVIIGNDDVERLSRDVLFTHWGKADENHTVCRFVTSWATTEAELEQLQSLL